jgi:hypothetical protein
MAQLTYATKPPIATPGLLADLGPNDIVSGKLMVGAVPFGVAIANTPGQDEQCQPVAAAVDLIRGVVVRSDQYDSRALASNLAIPAGDMVSILRRGRIWVTPVTAVAKGDPVFVVHAGGAFHATDDGVNASALPSQVARWGSSALIGQPAILEVDFTAYNGAMT